MTGLLIAAVLFLAYTNGANDNFKGVATLFGTGTASYRRSLALATVSTFAGSVLSMALAAALVKNFSGKGLIPDQFLTAETFTAVAVGASLAVFFATRIGMPVSTTHALVGGLVGVGVSSAGTVNLAKLGGTFFLPLVISPLLSATASVLVARIFAFSE